MSVNVMFVTQNPENGRVTERAGLGKAGLGVAGLWEAAQAGLGRADLVMLPRPA